VLAQHDQIGASYRLLLVESFEQAVSRGTTRAALGREQFKEHGYVGGTILRSTANQRRG
jgi:hypothetical protein